MVCKTVPLPGGGAAIVCGPRERRRKCRWCGRPADLLCDWKVPSRRSGTCDAPMCKDHSTSPAPEKDICPDHVSALRAWEAQR